MFAKLLLPAVLLAATSTAAIAQQRAATPAAPQARQPLTPAQQAQQQQLLQLERAVAQDALRIAQLVDQNKIGEVWDGASEVGKKAAPRAAFVNTITADRKTVGAVKSRTLAGVSITQSNGGNNTPAGNYINVAFATQFASGKQPARELISYHQDADQKWRVSGYTLR